MSRAEPMPWPPPNVRCRIGGKKCYKRSWAIYDTCSGGFLSRRERRGDSRYLKEVLKDVARKHRIDLKRIYFTGMSLGAIKAQYFSCNNPEIAAAVATTSGIGTPCACPGKRRPPLLHFHGISDPVYLYSSATRLLKLWSLRNKCRGNAKTKALRDRRNDGTRVERQVYQSCRSPLEHYKISGGSHSWPGGFTFSELVGRATQDINGNQVIWDFLKGHRSKGEF